MNTTRRMLATTAALLLAVLLIGGCKQLPNSVLRQRAVVARQQGDLDGARENYARAVAQHPDDWESQYQLGIILLQQGRPVDAQFALEQARVLKPGAPEMPKILDHLAEAMYQQNRPEQLQAILREASDEFGTVYDFLRQGDYLVKINEMDGARVAYQKAVRFAAPGDNEPYLKIASFYEQIGDSTKAVIALRNAHYINPTDPKPANRLREHGIVPGPTAALAPENTEP